MLVDAPFLTNTAHPHARDITIQRDFVVLCVQMTKPNKTIMEDDGKYSTKRAHTPTLFLSPVLAWSSFDRPLPFLSNLVHTVAITVKMAMMSISSLSGCYPSWPVLFLFLPPCAHASSFTLFFFPDRAIEKWTDRQRRGSEHLSTEPARIVFFFLFPQRFPSLVQHRLVLCRPLSSIAVPIYVFCQLLLSSFSYFFCLGPLTIAIIVVFYYLLSFLLLSFFRPVADPPPSSTPHPSYSHQVFILHT